jgi:hypothetical protein
MALNIDVLRMIRDSLTECGAVRIDTPIIAGSFGAWRLVYTVGSRDSDGRRD